MPVSMRSCIVRCKAELMMTYAGYSQHRLSRTEMNQIMKRYDMISEIH